MEKPLARLTVTKRKKTQITHIRNEIGGVTTDLADIKRIIKEHYKKKLYT